MKKLIKRGFTEILVDILSTCREPVNKTRIIYKCNLNFIMGQKYLGILLGSGLINLTNNKTKELFTTTEKGRKFIEYYGHMENLMIDKQTEVPIIVNIHGNRIPHI
jgi:predicted transcriptional regulator